MIYEILPNRSAAVFMRKDRKLRLFLFMTSLHHDALGTKPHRAVPLATRQGGDVIKLQQLSFGLYKLCNCMLGVSLTTIRAVKVKLNHDMPKLLTITAEWDSH